MLMCNICRQQGHAGSKTLHQQNPPVLNWKYWLTQVDVRKTVVVVVFLIYTRSGDILQCFAVVWATGSVSKPYVTVNLMPSAHLT